MIEIPEPEDVPEDMHYYIYRYIIKNNRKEEYRCGAFIGFSEDDIFEAPHMQVLSEDIPVEVFEVTREGFITAVRDLEANTTNFIHGELSQGEYENK